MAHELDLVDLVVTAQAGDIAAFERLVQRYQDFAYAIAFARVGDRQLALGYGQEAFLQAHRDLQSLREPRAFGAWLRRLVAKHGDRLRRGKHLITVPLDVALDACDDMPRPVDVVEATEPAELVRAEVNRLPERERVAIALYYVADRPQTEIAEFLQVPASTIKKRRHDARAALEGAIDGSVWRDLREYRPSQDDEFAQGVNFLIAVRSGDMQRAERQLAKDPGLFEVTLSGEDWGRAEMGHPTLPLEFDYTLLLFAANHSQRDFCGSPAATWRQSKRTVAKRDVTRSCGANARRDHGRRASSRWRRCWRGSSQRDNTTASPRDTRPCGDCPSAAGCGCECGYTGRVRTHARRLGRMRKNGSITLLVFDLLLPNTGYARAAVDDAEWDVQLVFDRVRARRGVYPAVDPVASRSRLLVDERIPPEHAATARELRDLLSTTNDPTNIRALQAIEFQSQPFYVAEPWTARLGAFVGSDVALAVYKAILEGAADAFEKGALLYTGAFPNPRN
jgi:RNA polymerase sigma-70 factor, ECF subfamily